MKLIPAEGLRSVFKNPYKIFAGVTHHGFFARMDDERYLRLLYRGVLGRPLHLDPPVNYSEKLQWLKLHDKNPIYPLLCDKLAVRDFVSRRIGAQYLIPLIGVWNNPNEIDIAQLPQRFVLKCTHDSGSVILCPNKSTFDLAMAREKLAEKLKIDYSIAGREWPYHDVPRRILAEAYLGAEDGTPPMDYKFFCFGGKVALVLVYIHHPDRDGSSYTFLPDFTPFSVYDNEKEEDQSREIARPPHFDEMIALAEKLSEGFIHMRVDLYDMPDGVKFGEITLHSSSGLSITMSQSGDRCLGDQLRLYLDFDANALIPCANQDKRRVRHAAEHTRSNL